jgi:hypothetical protein
MSDITYNTKELTNLYDNDNHFNYYKNTNNIDRKSQYFEKYILLNQNKPKNIANTKDIYKNIQKYINNKNTQSKSI